MSMMGRYVNNYAIHLKYMVHMTVFYVRVMTGVAQC